MKQERKSTISMLTILIIFSAGFCLFTNNCLKVHHNSQDLFKNYFPTGLRVALVGVGSAGASPVRALWLHLNRDNGVLSRPAIQAANRA